jgi:hypothetical protein
MIQNSSGSRKKTRQSSSEQQQKQLVTSLLALVPVEEVFHRNRTTPDAIQPCQVTLPPITLVAAPLPQATISCTVVQELQDQWLLSMEMPRVDMPINSLLEDQ